MVDFDAAVAAVQDPNADPVFLAKIAYENPEFGANVVANPRAYPGLKRWVAQFGDERARQQLVAMGWPVPQDGIMQQEAETASEQTQYQMPSEQAQYQQPQQSSEVQYQAQHQPPATQQCQPEPFAATPASNMANDASTESSTHIPTPQTCLKWLIFRRFSRKSQSRRMLVSPRNWP